MKRISFILILCLVLFSCNKRNDEFPVMGVAVGASMDSCYKALEENPNIIGLDIWESYHSEYDEMNKKFEYSTKMPLYEGLNDSCYVKIIVHSLDNVIDEVVMTTHDSRACDSWALMFTEKYGKPKVKHHFTSIDYGEKNVKTTYTWRRKNKLIKYQLTQYRGYEKDWRSGTYLFDDNHDKIPDSYFIDIRVTYTNPILLKKHERIITKREKKRK